MKRSTPALLAAAVALAFTSSASAGGLLGNTLGAVTGSVYGSTGGYGNAGTDGSASYANAGSYANTGAYAEQRKLGAAKVDVSTNANASAGAKHPHLPRAPEHVKVHDMGINMGEARGRFDWAAARGITVKSPEIERPSIKHAKYESSTRIKQADVAKKHFDKVDRKKQEKMKEVPQVPASTMAAAPMQMASNATR